MKITTEWLRKKRACAEQVAIFDREWPDGAELTPQNVDRAVALGLTVDWLLSYVLIGAKRQRYYAEVTPILEHCKAEVAPFWERYKAEVTPIWERYYAEVTSLWERYDAEVAPFWERYKAEVTSLWEHYYAEVAPVLWRIYQES